MIAIFITHSRRWDCKMHLKMGAKKDGQLTAIYQRALANIGAAALEENYYCMQIIWHTANLHACPNVYLEQEGVYTNRQITGPTRSPMNMPSIFGLESHMDRMAAALNMDPLAFRFKNYTTYQSVGTDEAGDPSAAGVSYDAKIPYSSKTLDKCMTLATDAIGWEKRKEYEKQPPESTKRRGIGMASYLVLQGVGLFPYRAEADVEIKNDGTVTLYAGIVDIGGGQQTIFPMIAAEELGVNYEDVDIVMSDTQGTRYGPSCHASRCTPEMGPAVLQAASDAREQIFQLVSPLLDAPIELLQSKEGRIYIKVDPTRYVDFKEVCRHIDPDKPIRGSGNRAPNPNAPMMATFGAQAIEVEVDTETGQVEVIRIAAGQDFGRAINPKLCISQIYGGIEFGVGFALMEEGVYDPETGILLSNNFNQYKMPTSLDYPAVDAMITEVEDPYFAFSAKGAGENTNAPTPAAIRNAIYNAIGIWFNDLPITPDKVLEAIKEKKGGR